MILSATLEELRTKFRRVGMRCEGVVPDGAMIGTVFETVRSGRFVQYLVRDPDPAALEAVRDLAGVTDFEDNPVGLEEVYAAVIGKPADVAPPRRPDPYVSTNGEVAEEEEVRP
jgi:ABC-2 type transport system ATP-binding protein